MSCGVGRRCGSDLALVWLGCRPASVAPIRPLAWESPYAVGVALKKQKKKQKKKKKERERERVQGDNAVRNSTNVCYCFHFTEQILQADFPTLLLLWPWVPNLPALPSPHTHIHACTQSLLLHPHYTAWPTLIYHILCNSCH